MKRTLIAIISGLLLSSTMILDTFGQDEAVSVPVDTVLHIEHRSGAGFAVVSTPITWKADERMYGKHEFACTTDEEGNCDIHVKFDSPVDSPSVFGSIYVHSQRRTSAIFLRSMSEITVPVVSSTNRLNPAEGAHSHEGEPVPITPPETVEALFTRVAHGETIEQEVVESETPIPHEHEHKTDDVEELSVDDSDEVEAAVADIAEPEQTSSGAGLRIAVVVLALGWVGGIVYFILKQREG